MAKYHGEFTPAQKTEIEYLDNAIDICKGNIDTLNEKLAFASAKKDKTRAHKVEEARDKEQLERYEQQLKKLETNLEEVVGAREKFDKAVKLTKFYQEEAVKLNKKWRFVK